MASPTPELATAATLTVLGIATGVDPHHVIAALLGALVSQFYTPSLPWLRRTAATAVSVILGAYAAPVVGAYAASHFATPATETATLAALLTGFMAHRVIWPKLHAIAAAKLDREAGR